MSNESPDIDAAAGRSESTLRHSVLRSLVTPYWPFNVLEMAYVTVGMTLAAADHAWTWELWAWAMVFIWLGSAGSNNMDLSDEELTLDIDSRVQTVVGNAMLLASVAVGAWLAVRTTWWFLVLVVAALLSSLAYTREWADGRFHDRKYATGLANLAFTAAWIPVVGGYLLVAQRVDVDLLGAGLVAFGLMVVVMAVDGVEDDLKSHKYETFDIVHDRDVEPNYERLERRAARQQPMNMLAICAVAVGLAVLFVV